MRHVDLPHDGSALVEPEDPAIIPLAKVKVRAVETQLRAGKLRTIDRVLRLEAMTGNEPADHAVVVLSDTADDAQLVADDGHAPRLPGHLLFFDDGPLQRIDGIKTLGLNRSHPQLVTVESERLWARRGRRQPQRLSYVLHAGSIRR